MFKCLNHLLVEVETVRFGLLSIGMVLDVWREDVDSHALVPGITRPFTWDRQLKWPSLCNLDVIVWALNL